MNKLFEAVPVSEKPTEGWHNVILSNGDATRCLYRGDQWHSSGKVEFWLRPVAPTKEAEQRAKELALEQYPLPVRRKGSHSIGSYTLTDYNKDKRFAFEKAYLKGHSEASTDRYDEGFEAALQLLDETYENARNHPYNLSDCIRAKVNKLATEKIRPASTGQAWEIRVLRDALERVRTMKRLPGENNDTYVFNRCWHIADAALSTPSHTVEQETNRQS